MAMAHTYISKTGYKTDSSFTRGKAIRQKCLDCCYWQEADIRRCPVKNCALHPFRMGSVASARKIDHACA